MRSITLAHALFLHHIADFLLTGSTSSHCQANLHCQLLLYQSALRLTRQHLSKEGKRRLCLCGRAKVLWLKLRFGLTPTEMARVFPISRASFYRYQRSFRLSAVLRGLLGAAPWNRSPAQVEALVRRMKRENPAWGKRRIALACLRLGVFISPNAVRNILLRPPEPRRPRHRRAEAFGKVEAEHPHALWSLDFTVVKLWGVFPVRIFAVLDHATRKVLLLKRVPHPTSRKACGLLMRLFRAVAVPVAVLTDRGCEFTAGAYRRLLRRFGVEDRKTRPRRPQTNGKVERFFQSLKQEYLHAFVIRSPRHLDRLLADYAEFYNQYRPHQSLEGLTPDEKMAGALWKPPPKDAKRVPRVRRLRLSRNGLLSAYIKEAA